MKLNISKAIYAALLALPMTAAAQSAETSSVDFTAGTGYTAIGFYDTWPESPFRTGTLKGNWEIVGTSTLPAPDDFQAPAKALGAQRSRFGSNTFGVRIDLEQPFELTNTNKYVHVVMHRPVSGRVMLIGIGESRNFPDNGDQVEQFWEISRNTVKPDTWTDAVFAVKGFGNISIKSLVVVPECESPHARTEDFAFYVASIEVNNSSLPTVNAENYPISAGSRFDNIGMTRTDRHTNSITFNSPSDGRQTVDINQQNTKKLYYEILDAPIAAKAGETIQATIGYNNTTWMHTYAYADWNNDGRFDFSVNEDGTPAEGSEILAYSHYNGKNSKGETANAGTSVALPSFTIPASVKPGIYRVRFKVDWDCLDPAGNDASGNLIAANGGIIADVMLNVHADEITVNDNQLNGEVLASDGSKLNKFKAPFGQPFKVLMNPEKGFTHRGLTVVYGNLEGDSVVMENPQRFSRTFTFKTDTFTIPGECMRGDVLIMGRMLEEASVANRPADIYGLNFPEDLQVTRTDRNLQSLTITGGEGGEASFSFGANPSPVYSDKSDAEPLTVAPGETVNVAVGYAGHSMHNYLFVDWNDDDTFDNTLAESGVPAGDKELVSYTCYNSKNSLGEAVAVPGQVSMATMPAFTVPADARRGRHFARFKIDWNNIDPRGNYYEGQGNKINDNGGYVVDFVINVEGEAPEQPAAPVIGTPAEFVTTTITADGQFAPGTQWYVITNGQDGAFLHDQGDAQAIDLPAGATATAADSELWCVTGSEAEGYRLYNRAAGTGKALASPKAMGDNTGGSAYAILKAPGDDTYIYDWDITVSTAWDAPAYFIGQHGIAANKLNSRDNKLAFWTGGAGLGSSFHFCPVTLPSSGEDDGTVTVLPSAPEEDTDGVKFDEPAAGENNPATEIDESAPTLAIALDNGAAEHVHLPAAVKNTDTPEQHFVFRYNGLDASDIAGAEFVRETAADGSIAHKIRITHKARNGHVLVTLHRVASQAAPASRAAEAADEPVWKLNVVVTGSTKYTATAIAFTPALPSVINIGRSATIGAALTPATSSDEVEWTVTAKPEDAVKVTVNDNGTRTLSAVKTGTATVTAKLKTHAADAAENTVAATGSITLRYAQSGIEEINADAAAGHTEIFDLAGRRLNAITAPGLYIVNGLKTIVR